MLGQEATGDKGGEPEAILALLDKLAEAGSLKGALVTIDTVACNRKIVDHGADYLLAVRPTCPACAARETSLHWVLDVTFREDLSRLHKGHGAKNMAIVRHFALNLVRHVPDKRPGP